MSWPLYMDHHVPWTVTSGLRQLGFDVLTAAEDHSAERDDDDLLDRATRGGRILVTQDRDFLSLAATRRDTVRRFVGVV
jgi:predicted nuclease of predicted toxin-antitoxin system